MLKKFSEKLKAKFPATTPGCSMLKIACLDDAFLEFFLSSSKSSRSSMTTAKRKQKEKKERKKLKIETPRVVGHFLVRKIWISAHARAQMSKNTIPMERRASCRVANAFSTRLRLIWPRSSLKTTKMSKKDGKKLQESMG